MSTSTEPTSSNIESPAQLAAVGGVRSGLRSRRQAAITLAHAGGLAVAPVIAYFALQARAMLYALMIDPYISTAYTLNGADLLRRFGASDYYWTRVGFQFPAHVLYGAFGPVAGFFLFRYVLAVVAILPVFLLFRRVVGTGAGWIAVITVLTSSVLITGWSTDYPTAAALSYLIAGTAALFMPAGSSRARALWALAAGVFFGLAIGCGLIAVLPIAGVLLGRVFTLRRDDLWRSIGSLALVAVGSIVAVAVLVVAARAYLGHGDIFLPQVKALARFENPANVGLFRSSTWRWLIDDIYVLVPPAILGAWVVAAWPMVRRNLPPAEVGLAWATGITYALYVVDQFVLKSWSLEYWLYADLLWAVTIPLLVFTVLRVAGISGDRAPARLVIVGVAVLAVPLILRLLRDYLHLRLGVALAAALVPAAAVLVMRLTRARALRLTAAIVVLVIASLLTVGQPAFVLFPGQIAYVTPDFGTALYGSVQPALDEYAVVTRMYQIIPDAEQVPGQLAIWLPQSPSHLVITTTGITALFEHALPDRLPDATAANLAYLRSHDVGLLILVSDTGAEFSAARTSLSTAQVALRTLADTDISSGSAQLHVLMLQLSYPS